MENKLDVLRNRFQIVSELSRGGMGAVYLANDLLRGCQVAVKKSFFSSKAQTRKGFELEAKLLARLDHSGLPKVIDYFISEGNVQTLVMDFVVGETLEEVLESGKLRRGCGLRHEMVLDWALQVLDVLRYLHNFDPPIVHRDIKPNNIKLRADGRIVLLDFGLAKGTSETIVGGMSGYSPIEQVHRTGTDPRSDIYALGTSMFHLLTDRYPYTALDRFREIYGSSFPDAKENGSPVHDPQATVAEINPEIPPALSAIVAKAMSLMPKGRYQSATEMKSAIIAVQRELEFSATRDSIQQTSVEIVKEWRKPKSLIDQAEPELASFGDDPESKAPDANEKAFSKPASQSEFGVQPSTFFDALTQREAVPPDSQNNQSSASKLGIEANESKLAALDLRQTAAAPDPVVSTPPVEDEERTPPAQNRRKAKHLVIGLLALFSIGSLTVPAWLLLSESKPLEDLTIGTRILREPISPVSRADNRTSLLITKYGVDLGGNAFPVDDGYRFAEKEGFKFGVKSSRDGFLYIISRDGRGDVRLAFPKRKEKDNYLKGDSKRLFLSSRFSFVENTTPEVLAYFVLALSRENELVRRIRKALADGTTEVNTVSSEVGELMNDLDKLAEDSKESEAVSVKILKLHKRQ